MSFDKSGSNTALVGPWGSQEGLHWDDGVYSTIRQIEIAHGAGIDSIRIEYDNDGKSVWSEKHGGRGGSKIDKIRLAYPEEYLTSLHGHYCSLHQGGPIFVRSLTFETNKRKYGPYGVEQGTFFTFPSTHGKIVGFLGKAGWYLDAIGAYLQPIHDKTIAAPVAAPTAVESVFHSQKLVAHGAENYEYSMIQGSLGPDYDLIVAVRHKDGKNKYLPIELLQKASHELIHTEHKDGKNNYLPIDLLQKTSHEHIHIEQKDGKKTSPPLDLLQKPSQDHSHTEHKNQAISGVAPIKIVELPSTNAKGNVTSGQGKIEKIPSKTVKRVVALGPWGGSGGTLFDDGVYDGIRQINVKRNVGVVSIRVCYDKNGQAVWGAKNGGTGSFKSDMVSFDYPSEVLTHITGYHGPTMIMGPEAIKSLTFHTTRRKYGPYGEEQGQFFSTKLKEGSVIVGLHGKKGMFVDAIGVHVLEGKVATMGPSAHIPNPVLPSMSTSKKPGSNSPSKSLNPYPVPSSVPDNKKPESHTPTKSVNFNPVLSSMPNSKKPGSSSPIKSNPQTALALTSKADNPPWPFNTVKQGQTDEVGRRMVKDPAPFGSGPWGGEGGKPWDDGVFTGIRQIVLTRQDAISCIEIEYDRNGQSVWSIKHGGTGGQTSNRVKLDYPDEVLTCVSGYYGPANKSQGTKVIQSLTFHTSRKKYGPFGEEMGTYFTSGTTEGKVVGFHGRSSMYLDAIGVHMQHWLGSSKLTKTSIMKYFS